ncbi:hypothetical protein E1B28_010119 [Marasmius oreades]|uniref:Uncharacterized protein n=1 Tax=Marasmius oreades TaxID=181124 RepID=A0A9P7RWL8_9AGAR|nr:uncharacterized protein E1B28_010119 [Marasmius oreades]KAG7091062.1 hypothetical protein E1B28_010119 [Marasmius oreades]
MQSLALSWCKRWRFFLVLVCCTLLVSYGYLSYRPPYRLYTEFTNNEIQIARNFLKDQVNPKFVKFKQLQGAGFNNQVQEILLFHHLSLISSRIYTYQPFIWRPRNQELPLSVFLPGPTKFTIPFALFNEVCSPESVTHHRILGDHNDIWRLTREILEGPDRCIEIDDWILNWNYLSSPALQKVWPGFQHYLSTHFEWSSQIQAIVDRAYSTLNLHSSGTHGEPYMALHIRRGDFPGHCTSLADVGMGFTTWATLPSLNDSILPPALDAKNKSSVMEHCYSSLSRILDAIDRHAIKKSHLRALYILHDGAIDHLPVYLDLWKLEAALKNPTRAQRAGWKNGPMKLVIDSSQVPIKWGENDFTVAVDVELARNAEVFIGNGYSSLSSQIVALRLGTKEGKMEDITLL